MSSLLTLVYATMLPGLKEIAAKHGYTLAIHGSMERDFDIVAIPWVDSVSPPWELIRSIHEALKCYDGGPVDGPEQKPHGRMAWVIPMGCGMALDVSVMPLIG